MKDAPAFAVLALLGLGIGAAISAITHRAEAWDAGLYWTAGIPAMALGAGVAAWLRPHRSWSLGFAIVGGSLLPMVFLAFRRGEIPSMWPVGLAFAAGIALACGAVARAAAALRKRGRT